MSSARHAPRRLSRSPLVVCLPAALLGLVGVGFVSLGVASFLAAEARDCFTVASTGRRVQLLGTAAATAAALVAAPPPARAEFVKTDSGLQYEIVREGKLDSTPPEFFDNVQVYYRGWIGGFGGKDGDPNAKLYTSCEREGYDEQTGEKIIVRVPLQFEVGTQKRYSKADRMVVRAWDEAVQTMKLGEKRRLIIPASLGFGPLDFGLVTPNSTLYDEITLIAKGMPAPKRGQKYWGQDGDLRYER
mmetsp:Transcript_30917/g.88976  ORF Transcript_30917/g.88976 Transcript_30917/m.88976 type:complete len:245 (+) Transcript_30917:87-821(+)